MEVKSKRINAINHGLISEMIDDIFDGNLHAKRILSLANATQGAITSASLAIHAIGHSLSVAQGTTIKHAIKQVDRLLSNDKLIIEDFFKLCVRYQVKDKSEIKVALDCTDFTLDDQTTFSIQLITNHGRTRALLWKTVRCSDLKNKQRTHEIELLKLLREKVPSSTSITLVGDRGFASLALLEGLKYTYIIRFLGNVYVEDQNGTSKTANKWLSESGRAKTIIEAKLTKQKYPVKVIACYKESGMTDGWFIMSNDSKSIGIDKYLKANTSRKRTLSLLRQGLQWYNSIPNMRENMLCPLIDKFNDIVANEVIFHDLFVE